MSAITYPPSYLSRSTELKIKLKKAVETLQALAAGAAGEEIICFGLTFNLT